MTITATGVENRNSLSIIGIPSLYNGVSHSYSEQGITSYIPINIVSDRLLTLSDIIEINNFYKKRFASVDNISYIAKIKTAILNFFNKFTGVSNG